VPTDKHNKRKVQIMQQDNNDELVSPVLATIFELGESGVVSVKGDVGNDCAKALHEVYARKVDPASGYILESMQQDQELEKAILSSVVAEKEYYNNQDKYYNLIWSIDPARITPVDLIDFKAAANETTRDEVATASMAIYISDEPQTQVDISPVMKTVTDVARDNDIKIIYGTEALVQHLRGL
jgi:hypothetical protein